MGGWLTWRRRRSAKSRPQGCANGAHVAVGDAGDDELSPGALGDAKTAAGELDGGDDSPAWRPGGSRVVQALIAGVGIVLAVSGLAGWFGVRYVQDRQAEQRRAVLVGVAKQGALNLTTIDFTQAEPDVQRILDSSTGKFLNEFQARSAAFVDFVKKAQSKTKGSISAVAVESEDGDEARVILALSVSTSSGGVDDPNPRQWRMRITVEKAGDSAKVSNVEFVP